MRLGFIAKQGHAPGLVELQGKSKCWHEQLKGGDTVGGALSSLTIHMLSIFQFKLSFQSRFSTSSSDH